MGKGINRIHSPISKNKNNYSFIKVYARLITQISGVRIFGVGKEANGLGWILDEGKVRFTRLFQHKGQQNIDWRVSLFL